LAAKALGAENVIALKMPYKTSHEESSHQADMMAKSLGIELKGHPITPEADCIFSAIPNMNRIRKGNVMARLRMILLFDSAAEYNAMVLGTGNKTEILLGYTTWYGDSACSLNAIGDLYKTQVWELSAFLDLPEAIIAKVPSADLWADQTDEGELGITYEMADAILYHLVDKRYSIEKVLEEGFERRLVDLVVERMRKYQFKRMMPPVPKLSPRTVGEDFLYSRDWGT
jgi:NAD+ synthase